MPIPSPPTPITLTVTAKARSALARRHPWVFSGGLKNAGIKAAPGQTVSLTTENGDFLATGAWSPHSQIRVRIWSCDARETIDAGFFHRRLAAAVTARRAIDLPRPCSAMRLVNAESDGLPGLVVDQYGDYLVCQFLAAGTESWKQVIVDQLVQLVAVKGIYERSDGDVRAKEGLLPLTGVLWGASPPAPLEIQVGPLRMLVDVYKGHKTGFYLDQRENQAFIARYAAGAEMLNCFSYSGACALWALQGGAERVTNIDASRDALDLADQNLTLNNRRAEQIQANVFEQLRRYRDVGRTFDLIILDPPKFVASAAQMGGGTRGYKDINLLAFKLLKPGGILFTFSCSGLVMPPLFQKIVADAALDAERRVRFIHLLHQAADHPIASFFPEGHYLKGLVCLVE